MIRTALAATTLAVLATVAPAIAMAQVAAPVVTHHHGDFGGRHIGYRAFVEGFDATAPDGTAVARLGAISYVADGATPARPVLFVFNGGPIGPSNILHIGAFGPKRVAIPDDVTASPATFRLVDNLYTPLDVADIVFFDPAGTGYSRFAPGIDPKTQFGIDPDARQLQQLVLAWTKAHAREASPVYLVGESYGTLRAPAAVGRAPAGLILLGQAVNIVEYAQRRDNIISYAVSLPTLAATAWAHGRADRRGRDFDRFMADAKAYGGGDYLSTLFAGDRASPERQQAVARELAAFTGIPAADWIARRLRMTKVEYQRALVPGRRLATNDARYIGPADGPDPFDIVPQAYARFFADYAAHDLGAARLGPYVTTNPAGSADWDYGPAHSPFGDWPYGRAITALFATQPGFRLLVANGYTDTQTTVGAMDYLVAQGGWPRDRVRTAEYQGGHMPYTIERSLERIGADVRAMVTRAW